MPRLLIASICALVIVLAGWRTGQVAARAAQATGSAPELQLQVASSDLAVGRNRFTFGLIDANHPLKLRSANVTFFRRVGNSAILVVRSVAHFNYFAHGLKKSAANALAVEIGGVFVVTTTFTHAGEWAVVATIRYGGKSLQANSKFTVATHSVSPAVGTPAPRSRNPTIHQFAASKLDSGKPPDDMHRLSIAGAIAQRKPLVVLFATAAFCTSRMCGPEIEQVLSLERTYRTRVNFVHIEIYKNANPQYGYADTVIQWHLLTEPWVFVIDRRGIIRAKFEGPTPAGEINPTIVRVITGPVGFHLKFHKMLFSGTKLCLLWGRMA